MNKQRNHTRIVLPIIIVIVAALVMYAFSEERNLDQPSFTANNTDNMGVSLFYDTLRHMGYNVTTSRRPITANTNMDYVHVIIQPPTFFRESAAEEILDWVYNGGFLVFLHNSRNNVLEGQIPGHNRRTDDITQHRHGQGTIVTGAAARVTNHRLILDHTPGTYLHSIISGRSASGVAFVEYYHSPPAAENFWTRLPLIVRIIFIQMVLVAIMAIWHLGKRFGNPVQYYQETERDENEHVHALAKLYWKAKSHYEKRRTNHDN